MPILPENIRAAIVQHPLLIVTSILLVMVGVLISLPITQSQIFLAPQGEADRFYFGGSRVVGQTMPPPVGLSEVIIPLGTASDMKGPLILHLREDWHSADIRTSTVYSMSDENVHFRFPILINPPDQLLWLLEAPHGTSQSYWVYREKDETVKVSEAYLNQQKIKGNFGYEVVKRLPLIIIWLSPEPVEGYWHPAHIRPFEQAIGWAGLLITAVTGVLMYLWPRWKITKNISESTIVLGCIVIGVLLHIPLAMHMPLINDEGAYIQDVLQAKISFMPLREYLTKGPAYLALLKFWQLLAPHTVLGWRALPMLSWAAATGIFWLLLRQLVVPRLVRGIAVACMSLLPAAIALTTPLLLQTSSVPVLLLALLAVTHGARRSLRRYLVLGALIITLAFFIRVSSVVGGCLGVLLIGFLSKKKVGDVLVYIGTGIGAFLVIFVVLMSLLGWQKALVASNAEAFIISEQRAQKVAAADHEPLIRELTIESRVLWRGAPILIFGLFALPLAFIERRRLVRSSFIATASLSVAYQVYWHLSDTRYLLPGAFTVLQLLLVGLVFGGILLMVMMRFTGRASAFRFAGQWSSIVVFTVWLILLAYLYLQWGRFRQNYLVEFIPPLSLLAAWGCAHFIWNARNITPTFLRKSLQGIGIFLVASLSVMGWYMSWLYPHTGTIAQRSLKEFSQGVARYVAPGQVLFTAQPNITAFSRRPILFGYSHPGWYREARFHTIPDQLLYLFFAPPARVTEYLQHEAAYVAMDVRTYEIYFDGYPERQQMLDELFVPVFSVPNDAGGGTLELYERKK